MNNNIMFHCIVHGDLCEDEIIFSRNGKYFSKKCKKCCRDKSLFKRTGITRDQKILQFHLQNGVCKICKKSYESKYLNAPWESLFADHCHKTKTFRGLLCRSCNSAIGKMNEDINLLEKCIEYLEIK